MFSASCGIARLRDLQGGRHDGQAARGSECVASLPRRFLR
nr:MAG TPA: hypothetical protein [Caudoviricetes sp.]